MPRKRYSLEDVVPLVERLTDKSPTTGRRALVDLVEAQLGPAVVSRAAVAAVRQAGNPERDAWLRDVRASLRRGVGLERSLIGYGIAGLRATVFPTRIELSGAPRAMLLAQANALRGLVGERLTLCDCERLFVRVGKRQFCSERCQKRVYMRRARAIERERE